MRFEAREKLEILGPVAGCRGLRRANRNRRGDGRARRDRARAARYPIAWHTYENLETIGISCNATALCQFMEASGKRRYSLASIIRGAALISIGAGGLET